VVTGSPAFAGDDSNAIGVLDVRMARLGRIIAAGFPQHVTQRRIRCHTIFFQPAFM
jgi:hypothetical protein